MRLLPLCTLLVVACDVDEPQPIIAGTTSTPAGAVFVTDEHLQDHLPAADVLIVADPSDADEVLRYLPILLDYGLGTTIDWHVGLTTTALGGTIDEVGRIGWTTIDDPNPTQQISVPTAAGGPLGAIGAVEAALLLNPNNTGFRRSDAPLHLLVVARADDATPYADPVAFLAALTAGSTEPVTISASVPTTAAVYLDLVASTGGHALDIASQDDPAEVLDETGLTAFGLTRTYPLSQAAVPGTIEVDVFVGGNHLSFPESVGGPSPSTQLGGGWTLDAVANTITFDQYVPEPGSTVQLRYEAAP